MAEPLRIPISELRRVLDVLLTHVEDLHGEVVELPDAMFWAVAPDERTNVLEKPGELTIGELGESWANALGVAGSEDDAIWYALVWVADVLRAIGDGPLPIRPADG